ncbi:THAP domain-containing protein 5 isoform X1 [Anolis carolinensis]|nr:PREDICTED: THAP domain-containing protein 5 isoform X1 [Anolis carolinensis]|eukprot:XP_003215346.1 PREDICTED: THAP domain-containing protein 5 isoform X1 [Anolis carolinensis]
MPRYCAAACCRNRAGQSARDQRRLSFYPFPLHDKERLEKWLRNMKCDSWTPSKHQVLCSDHFTPDSLDVRWGIRYLKTTAVPTIFSSSDNQAKGLSKKKMEVMQNAYTNMVNIYSKPYSPKINNITEESLSRKAPCIISNMSSGKEILQNTIKIERDITNTCNSVRQDVVKASSMLIATELHDAETIDFCSPATSNSVENLTSSRTKVLQSSVHDLHSCLEPASDSKATILQATHLEHLESFLECNNITIPMNEISSDQLDSLFADCAVEVQEMNENSVLFHTVSKTLEQFNGGKESVIAIIVPSEGSSAPLLLEGSFLSAEQEFVNAEAGQTACITDCSSIDMLQTEHSYCRQDTEQEQLWQKIAKLHSKIELLEVQERKTLNRLKSLEALIASLKQENLLSEEKLKIVENCFTTFEVTMIQ